MNEREALTIITNALDDDSIPVYEALQILHTLERKCNHSESRVKLLEQQVDAMDKAVLHTQRLYEASQRALTKALVENRENAVALEETQAQAGRLQDVLNLLINVLAIWKLDPFKSPHTIEAAVEQARAVAVNPHAGLPESGQRE